MDYPAYALWETDTAVDRQIVLEILGDAAVEQHGQRILMRRVRPTDWQASARIG